jgi:uncharacterized protein YuzE
MRIRYVAEVDALSIVFQETTVTTRELADGVVGEYDLEGRLVGLELLDATSRLGGPAVLRQVILEGVGVAPIGAR